MKIFPISIALLYLSVPAGAARADSIEKPTFDVGDSWKYAITVEKGKDWSETHDEISVARVTRTGIYVETKASGSSQAPTESIWGEDWSRIRSVDGQETVVNRPLAFPLSQGKLWDVKFTEAHPNKQLHVQTTNLQYSVVGSEDVSVPAGTFHAIKIEAEGTWSGELEPAKTVVQGVDLRAGDTTMVTQAKSVTPQTVTGHIYKAFWYAPEVKRWVKSVEEMYNSAGVRNERTTTALEAVKLADK